MKLWGLEYRFHLSFAGTLAWTDMREKEGRGVTVEKKYSNATGKKSNQDELFIFFNLLLFFKDEL